MRCTFIIAWVILLSLPAASQVRSPRRDVNRLTPQSQLIPEAQKDEVHAFFERVTTALKDGEYESLATMLHPTVHLSLPGVELGQYSSNQASQLLTAYLGVKVVSAVEERRLEYGVVSPYLSSRLTLQQDGRRETLNLYISLVRSSGQWAIAHFSLY